jgi:hypothetical protein
VLGLIIVLIGRMSGSHGAMGDGGEEEADG